jgi:hypothetical protein
MDGPAGLALGALGVIAVGASGTAVWLVKRNARHGQSRKQKRLRNYTTTNPEI